MHREGSHRHRSSTQIDTSNRESCAGIGCVHPFESALARTAPRSRADQSTYFPLARICKKVLSCRDNLNRMRRRRATGENRIQRRCDGRAIPRWLHQALLSRLMLQNRPAPVNSRSRTAGSTAMGRLSARVSHFGHAFAARGRRFSSPISGPTCRSYLSLAASPRVGHIGP